VALSIEGLGVSEVHDELVRVCKSPRPEDEAILIALLPKLPWELRCDAIEALANFGTSGRKVIVEWLVMERHPIVIFYCRRELICQNDPSVQNFLDGASPPSRAKNLRSLWALGNYLRGKLSRSDFEEEVNDLCEVSPLEFGWLRDELECPESAT
jgi:hypothetical protein